MTEKRFIYRGKQFPDVNIEPINYSPSFFQMELDLESDVFYELRLANGILPVRINESTSEQLDEIKSFFLKNKDTFYFLFSNNQELIASILHLNNYIQALSVSKIYQRQGYGEQLSKYCINRILSNGYSSVELNVLAGNDRAEKLYRKLGFVEVSFASMYPRSVVIGVMSCPINAVSLGSLITSTNTPLCIRNSFRYPVASLASFDASSF